MNLYIMFGSNKFFVIYFKKNRKNFHFTFICPSNNLGNDISLKFTLKNYIYFEINFKEKFKVINI